MRAKLNGSRPALLSTLWLPRLKPNLQESTAVVQSLDCARRIVSGSD